MIRIILALLFLFLIMFLKKVPKNTVIIIDKNSHYYKTITSDCYYLALPNREITTRISTNPIRRTLTNYYETYDGKIVNIGITCDYKAANLDLVLESLANVRRSIDDIIQSSVYFAANSFNSRDITTVTAEFRLKVQDNLRLELDTIGVTLTHYTLNVYGVAQTNAQYFKPHMSSHDTCGTTDYNSCKTKEYGINSEDPNADPIKFY